MLTVKNLHVAYGRKIRALQGVSLNVGVREIVCLIGANGAGKSTLLKTLSGLLPVDEGEILFDGHRIDGEPAHDIARRGLIHVPEGRRIFPRLTVRENLEMGAYLQSGGARFRRDLDRVVGFFPVLADRLEQFGGTLSGGEQQMLAIGRALMAGPRLLLLDEPSMGLAPLYVERIFRIIGQINAEGTPILLVEQNAHQALRCASRGYVLETGRLVLEGPAEALAEDPTVRAAYLGVSG
jgi:branched-chain amino acid transport system ATP-binding protein